MFALGTSKNGVNATNKSFIFVIVNFNLVYYCYC